MKRGPKLRSAGDVSSFLARIIRETYKGSLNPKTAGTLGYLCNCLKGCLEASELEQRITTLEEQLAQQRNGKPARPMALPGARGSGEPSR